MLLIYIKNIYSILLSVPVAINLLFESILHALWYGPVQRQNRSGHLLDPFKHVVGNRGQGSFLELFHSAIPFLSLDDLVLLVLRC